MISPEVKNEIVRRLLAVETEHNVRILFAIESGSRAWGFASPNSDYDVRFVYMKAPEWYQAVDLEERRDVIEYPIVDEIDLNGWDVRKSLRLFWKSNPAFVEWIQSPITYIEHSGFRTDALNILQKVYTPISGIYHYRNMAKTNYRGYLREPIVPLKKYFYVLRPLLAVRWLIQHGTAAPIEFEKLLTLLRSDEAPILAEIHHLLEKKRSTPELGREPAVPLLNEFIKKELDVPPLKAPKKSGSPEIIGRLNEIFHNVLNEYRSEKPMPANNALR